MHGKQALRRRRVRFTRAIHGEAGSSLVIVLVIMIVMGLILSALMSYAVATSRSSKSYATVREERYAGDSAIKAGVAWAAANPLVGRDPEVDLSDPDCRYQYDDAAVGPVTVSCEADSGGGSGSPADVGLAHPEALVLLGERDNEPGPYNDIPCSGWWDTASNWFKLDYQSNENAARGQVAEPGGLFRSRSGLGTLSATCGQTRTRTRSTFTLEGNLAAKGKVLIQDGGQLAIVKGTGQVRGGCPSGMSPCTTTMTNRTGLTGAMAYLNGTGPDTDPGRNNPATPAQNPVGPSGDMSSAFQSVAFDPQGNPLPLGYPVTSTMPSKLPQRSTAYLWNSDTGALTPTNSCVGTSATVVFLPGWYRDVEVLNRYTATAACADTTMWFAPDPGPDNLLLTEDDVTGAFYMDFRSGSGRACNGMPAIRNRWCVGGDASHSPRVVVGTPQDWTPQGAYTAGANPTTRVSIATANTVDKDLSQSWYNDPAVNASTIDGNWAKYRANRCFIYCFSSDRAIRVRDLTPKVTTAPVDGKVFVTVAYAVENPTAANPAQAVIEAVSPASGRKQCGSYSLLDHTASNAGSDASPSIKSYTFTDAQATELGTKCGKTDLINGLEIKVQVTGNGLNSPRTNWYLDGVKVEFDAVAGASFPAPTGVGAMPAAAKLDCDADAAGGQLIFGGDSHLYVADGSMEVCAGRYPTDPNNHQSIGIWAPPAVSEVLPSGAAPTYSGDTDYLIDPQKSAVIDGDPMGIRIPGCAAFCGGDRDARATVPMNGYTPPSGYKIQKVTARVGYHSNSEGCSGLFGGCTGAAPSLQTPSCIDDFPKVKKNNPNVQITNYGSAVLYQEGGRDCLNIGASGGTINGHSITWHARVNCVAGICGGPYTDKFDGIAYQVHLVPTGTNDLKLIPQSGCIVSHPNYNGGTGNPDCALVRAETSNFGDNWSLPWANAEGTWTGRIGVIGSVYAPSSAYEIDDTDAAYPLASRGAVLRHLRISGYGLRPGYSGSAIGSELDLSPNPRDATFTACTQTAARRGAGALCDEAAGDTILTRAGVRFEVDTAITDPAVRAVVPKFDWWSNSRT